MTRREARRHGGPDVPGPEDDGRPDPTEDPILYLQELKEDEE
jgi:hypothetical protein